MGFNPFRAAIGVGTLGLSELAGEDTMSKIPLLGGLGGYESDAQKALQAKQRQMAEEAKKREAINQQARMNALGQQVLAFNPRNQALARMFGPEAAFSPQQFGQMTQNPYGKPQLDPSLVNYRGNNPQKQAQVEEFLQKKKQEEERQRMIHQGMTPLGPGPAPLRMPQPQPRRRF